MLAVIEKDIALNMHEIVIVDALTYNCLEQQQQNFILSQKYVKMA